MARRLTAMEKRLLLDLQIISGGTPGPPPPPAVFGGGGESPEQLRKRLRQSLALALAIGDDDLAAMLALTAQPRI